MELDPGLVLDAIPQASLWRRLWVSLAALPRPPRLTVWIDDSADTWSDMTNTRF